MRWAVWRIEGQAAGIVARDAAKDAQGLRVDGLGQIVLQRGLARSQRQFETGQVLADVAAPFPSAASNSPSGPGGPPRHAGWGLRVWWARCALAPSPSLRRRGVLASVLLGMRDGGQAGGGKRQRGKDKRKLAICRLLTGGFRENR
jgi:hypothetical protein